MVVTSDETLGFALTNRRRQAMAMTTGGLLGALFNVMVTYRVVEAISLIGVLVSVVVCVISVGIGHHTARRRWCKHAWINLHHDKVKCMFCGRVSDFSQIDPRHVRHVNWPTRR